MNSSLQPKLIITADGSHSLFIAELDEQYHSVHGAIRESNHIYIDAGLRAFQGKELQILEVGFGTGLNALLTAIYAAEKKILIHYTSLEPYPLSEEITQQLNFPQLLDHPGADRILADLHSSEWEKQVRITEGFNLIRKEIKLQDIEFRGRFDLVYFDAFAPRVQPELWQPEQFMKIFDAMNEGGILVTYCAKGEVKRTLKACGFIVETLQGPPGKNEMVRATKPAA